MSVYTPNTTLCTFQLLSLKDTLPRFLSALSSSSASPLVTAKVARWIVTPTKLSISLLTQDPPWDILLVFSGSDGLPKEVKSMVQAEWTVATDVPTQVLSNSASTTNRLLHPQPRDVPSLTGSLDEPRVADSGLALELTEQLEEWMRTFGKQEGRGAVSMLNLLAYNEGKKEGYMEHVKASGESVGSRRGAVAKIVGHVLGCSSSHEGVEDWDDIGIVHYPSISHFADLLASRDYREADHKYKVGTLKDTCILCTTELDLPTEKAAKAEQ